MERIVFSTVPNRDSRFWPLVVQIFSTMGFCTIIMHIMFGTCVLNLRGRWWVEHTQMHPVLKKGTKYFHYISNFHYTYNISNKKNHYNWRNFNGLLVKKVSCVLFTQNPKRNHLEFQIISFLYCIWIWHTFSSAFYKISSSIDNCY